MTKPDDTEARALFDEVMADAVLMLEAACWTDYYVAHGYDEDTAMLLAWGKLREKESR